MKTNREHSYATWGYLLITLAIVGLAFALATPQASVSMAQEVTATRPAPAPTKPGPGPTRETPVPPTSPPEPTVTPGPTSPPKPTSPPGESPVVEATAAPVPVVMPETGGAGGGFILLLIGLAFTAVGIGASVGRYRRKCK